MAYFGLSNPYIAKYLSDGNYTEGFKCGNAVSTSVTPAYNEGSVFGDNKQTEYLKEFKNAAVEAGVTSLPLIAKSVLFGHEINGNEEISNTEDAANYVGYGFISNEMIKGKRQYGACVLLKVLFAEGADSYATKGDSITFSTPTISGTAIAIDDGKWRKKKFFDTKKEAEAYIEAILNITPKCETPVFSVDGGTYAGAQSVEISCATSGAKIYYTTDGLTPTESSTEYTGTPVSVSASKLLRAIAIKAGSANSDVASAEYTISG